MNIKKILSIVIVICMMLTVASFPAVAATTGETADGFVYSIEDDEVTITDYTGSATTVIIPSTIDGYPVTTIGERAFYGCTYLEFIRIPNSVTAIAHNAFIFCRSLAEIKVDSDNPNYYSQNGILFNKNQTVLIRYPADKSGTSYTVPTSVIEIGACAFHFCSNLVSISLPESIEKIGSYAFFRCESLNSINVDTNNLSYCSKNGVLFNKNATTLIVCPAGKSGSYAIPDNVTEISTEAFFYCSKLAEIGIPDSVATIGDYAFSSCYSLTSITVPDSVTTIGNYAFEYCEALTSVTIGDSVTTIGDYAFYGCSKLKTVYYNGTKAQKDAISIYSSNTPLTSATWHYVLCEQNGHTYDNACDKDCNVCGYERVVVPEGLKYSIENSKVTITGYTGSATEVVIPSTIENCPVIAIGDSAFYACKALVSVTIPDSVTSIGSSAFCNCTSLKDITIPNGVTSIDTYTFRECSSLESVDIPDSVTAIGYGAFYACTKLTHVTLGDGVISIGNRAFYMCQSLTSIPIPASVATIGDWAFYSYPYLKDVYYNGTKAQKDAILIGDNNTPLTDATWHYVLCEQNEHTYDNNCDADCNVCGETRETEHTYDNVCDTDCNKCGATRTTTHTYDNDCDADCNICGETRVVGNHIYDNEYDTDCNICGDVREVADPNAPTFVVESKKAKVGDTFTVEVSTKNNAGIISLKLMVGYDASLLELVSIEGKDFEGTTFGPLTANPIAVNWEDVLSPNNTSNSTVAVLTFKVKETATEGDTTITITYDPEDVFDENYDNVAFVTEEGTINIIEYIPGDVNGDGTVNNKDLGMLRQNLNGWGNTIDLRAADVTGDGRVNNKDLGILRQYLNGWDVVLK